MVIYSELTGETYDTVDECLGAEHKYKKDKEEVEKAEKERQKLLDEAYTEAIKACERYLDLAGVSFEIDDEEDEEDDFDEWFAEKIAKIFEL